MVLGDIKIKAVSGAHEAGLRVWINDQEMHHSPRQIIFALLNSSTQTGTVIHPEHGRFSLDLPLFHIEVINSDYFFNLEIAFKDNAILKSGRKEVVLNDKVLCAKPTISSDRLEIIEKIMSKHYPRVLIHGLIGQTWRNAITCNHAWVGEPSDYVTSGLFAADSVFNYYGKDQ